MCQLAVGLFFGLELGVVLHFKLEVDLTSLFFHGLLENLRLVLYSDRDIVDRKLKVKIRHALYLVVEGVVLHFHIDVLFLDTDKFFLVAERLAFCVAIDFTQNLLSGLGML